MLVYLLRVGLIVIPSSKYINYIILKKYMNWRDVIMCRLGGVVLSQGVKSEERATEITENLLMLLVRMEDAYGGDGNGISLHHPSGTHFMLKDHREANYFFRHFETIKKAIMGGYHIIQLHARLSTGGSSLNHDNLHPFVHGDIVGAHNGTIEDSFIWQELKGMGVTPYSDVDSEAIIASMNTFAHTLHPKLVQSVIEDLYGMFALTLWSKARPNQLLIMRQDNPLAVWKDDFNNEVWYASTEDLFPDSLNVSTIKVKEKYKHGAKIGQYYMKTVKDVITLGSGDGMYIRSSLKGVTIESVEFNVDDTSYYSGYAYRGGGYYSNGYYEDEWANVDPTDSAYTREWEEYLDSLEELSEAETKDSDSDEK